MTSLGGIFKRTFFVFLAIAVAGFISARIYYALTDDFRVSNITYEMPYNKSWEIPTPSSDDEQSLQQILGQTFIYLGKGAQSYAFVSADGNYVLKFFKFKHLKPSLFLDLMPDVGPLKSYKTKQTVRKQRKLFGVFNSYKLAYDVDRDESGLLFIQLNNTGNPERFVTLRYKIGLEYTVDVSNIPFVLQKRGETLRVVLDKLLTQGDVNAAEERIGQIFDLYAGEYAKGIYDHDHGVMRNVGFVGNQPLHLDVGKLLVEKRMQDKGIARQDALLVADKMKGWIKKSYPEDFARLSAYIDHKIHLLFD